MTEAAPPLEVPLLGIDPGTRRVGVALANALKIVTPIGYLCAEPHQDLLRKIAALAEDRQCQGIVVGLPLHMNGNEGKGARAARLLGEEIAETSGLPVAFCDERLTSFEAEQKLRDAGLTRKRLKRRVDAVAAATLLEAYLAELETRENAQHGEA